MDDKSLPTGIALTPLNEDYRKDPYPTLRQLREHAPVHHDQQLNRFVLTRYDDVRSLLRAPDYFTDPHKAREDSFSRLLLRPDDSQLSMLLLDEPEHRRLRGLINHLFGPSEVQAWRPHILQTIEQQLEQLPGPEFDLIADYAGPIPTVVIAGIIGIPADRHEDFRDWSDTCIEAEFSISPSDDLKARGQAAMESLQAYFAEQIALRRERPGDDIISHLLEARFEGESLTDIEIINQCELLLIAGNASTKDLIGNGIKALLQHPEQLDQLRRQPELIESAVEEVLRFDTPVTSSARITPDDVSIHGCPVRKGECLTLSLAAANRDPDVFPNPDQFVITRDGAAHQSFGGGRHHCLGASLARLEAQEAIIRLLQHFPDLMFAERGLEYIDTPPFRGMKHCWLRGTR